LAEATAGGGKKKKGLERDQKGRVYGGKGPSFTIENKGQGGKAAIERQQRRKKQEGDTGGGRDAMIVRGGGGWRHRDSASKKKEPRENPQKALGASQEKTQEKENTNSFRRPKGGYWAQKRGWETIGKFRQYAVPARSEGFSSRGSPIRKQIHGTTTWPWKRKKSSKELPIKRRSFMCQKNKLRLAVDRGVPKKKERALGKDSGNRVTKTNSATMKRGETR